MYTYIVNRCVFFFLFKNRSTFKKWAKVVVFVSSSREYRSRALACVRFETCCWGTFFLFFFCARRYGPHAPAPDPVESGLEKIKYVRHESVSECREPDFRKSDPDPDVWTSKPPALAVIHNSCPMPKKALARR